MSVVQVRDGTGDSVPCVVGARHGVNDSVASLGRRSRVLKNAVCVRTSGTSDAPSGVHVSPMVAI